MSARSDLSSIFNVVKGGVKTIMETQEGMNRDDRERDQRWANEEEKRRRDPVLSRPNRSVSAQGYEAWANYADKIIEYLYERAQRGLVNFNLHDYDGLNDATVCRKCVDVDTAHNAYYRSNDWKKHEDDYGWIVYCSGCLRDTRGFHQVDIQRSLPQPEPDYIRCSNQKCGRACGDVFLYCEKCSGASSHGLRPFLMCMDCAFAGAMCNSRIIRRHQMRVVARGS